LTVADLPPELRERYIGKGDKWLLRIFARDCLWDYGPLRTFTAQIHTVDPEATGKPFSTLAGLRGMKHGFQWAGFYALGVIVLVLLLDFRDARMVLLALAPLGMGMLLAVGVMALCRVPLNPANMIAFPLIVGVGVDNGVHVLHDFLSRRRGQPYRLSQTTGRGILVAARRRFWGLEH
jgi:predicted RND superfamily exporter protein